METLFVLVLFIIFIVFIHDFSGWIPPTNTPTTTPTNTPTDTDIDTDKYADEYADIYSDEYTYTNKNRGHRARQPRRKGHKRPWNRKTIRMAYWDLAE